MSDSIDQKLSRLRQRMQAFGLDYYFAPSADQHQNEYVPACWQRRQWISGFTGSAGDALIGQQKAYLWTDSRYFLQADQELDASAYELVKMNQGSAPVDKWLAKHQPNAILGVDPKVININLAKRLQKALTLGGGTLVSVEKNLIDQAWENRPPIPQSPVYLQKPEHAGTSTTDKLSWLRKTLAESSAEAHVITSLDAIAWLFNIRGNDVQFNPLVISYAIVTQTEATLFIDDKKLSETEYDYFKEHGITIKTYLDIQTSLNQLTGTVWVDPNTASWWVEQQLTNASILLRESPITLKKAIKNETELAGMRAAHRMDGISVIRFLHWLDTHWSENVTEISAADTLEAIRRDNPACLGLSFDTIAGFAAHGAIVHYHANDETNSPIDDSALFLIDSGAQYREGTTDITRTLHLGTPTEQEKHHYTLVLKGHLALRQALFPKGTCGEHINTCARLPLWQAGLDFGHGTGHGVGSHLCVHEGPQRIASSNTGVPLEPGMIVSNEPGLYLADQYGIRIENLCEIVEVIPQNKSLSGHGPFYQLKDLTLVPYAKKLINTSELTESEIAAIDEYHQAIYDTLHQDIQDPDTLAWLKEATQPLR